MMGLINQFKNFHFHPSFHSKNPSQRRQASKWKQEDPKLTEKWLKLVAKVISQSQQ